MALFSFGKDSKDDGQSQLVLAYLEEAQRLRCPFMFKDLRKITLSAVIQAVNEEEGTFSLQISGQASVEKGAKTSVVFILDNLRLGATVQVVGTRAGLVELAIPSELELLERRKLPRARLNPREGATVTALTGLFEGVGITGTIENLSEGGTRIRVDKALNIKGEKRLPLGSSLLQVGQAFILVKLNKVPKCIAVMELTGKVAYLDDTSGLCIGINLEKPRADLASSIRSFVSSRSAAIPSTVPPKSRRSVEPQEEPLSLAKPTPAPKVEATPPPSAPEAPAESPTPKENPSTPLAADAALPPSSSASAELEPRDDAGSPVPKNSRNPALLKLKKKTRTILALVTGGHGDLLRDHLQEEGYGRIVLSQNWEEVSQQLVLGNVSLLFLDCATPVLESMEMVQRLQEAGVTLPPVILAADEVSRGLVIAAHRAGVSQLLVKPYQLDDALSATFESVMGIG